MTDASSVILREYLDRYLDGGAEPFDELCTAYPEHAAELRVLYGRLTAAGVITGADSLEVFAPDLPGFRIVRRLGSGGMGTVFEAEQLDLGRHVAIKLIRAEVLDSAVTRERFERESASLARLRHPNIVSVHATGTCPYGPYSVMELVDGKALREWIPSPDERLSAVEIRTRVRFAIELGRALEYTHERGIIHRDVSPANVLIDARGAPILIDFGLVLHEDEQRLTHDGDFVGTLAYTAPEQALGAAMDRRVDVYGLGATLHHLLTGRLRFEVETVSQFVRETARANSWFLPHRSRVFDADLVTILEHATAPDPRRRYASCADLANDLEAWTAGRPIAARRASLARRWFAVARRYPARTALAVVAAIAVWLGIDRTIHAVEQREAEVAARRDKQLLSAIDFRQGGFVEAARGLLDDLLSGQPGNLEAWHQRVLSELWSVSASRLQRPGSKVSDAAALAALRTAPDTYRQSPAGRWLAALALDRTSPVPATASTLGARRIAEVANLMGRTEVFQAWREQFVTHLPADSIALRLLASGADETALEAAYVLQHADPQNAANRARVAVTRHHVELEGERDPKRQRRAIVRRAEEAYRLDPNSTYVTQAFAYLLQELAPERSDLAAQLNRSLLGTPLHALVAWNLNNILGNSDPAESIRLLRPIEANYGHLEQYWHSLAWSMWETGDREVALETLARGSDRVTGAGAYEISQLHAEYLLDLARYDSALEAYDRSAAIAPDTTEALDKLRNVVARLVNARSAKGRDAQFLDRLEFARSNGTELTRECLEVLRKMRPHTETK